MDAQQHDGFVAGDGEAPELALVQRRAFRRPAHAVHQRRAHVLQCQVFLRGQRQVAQPHLGQCRGHAGCTLHMHGLQVFVDAGHQLVRRLGGCRGKAQSGQGAGRQPQRHAQAGHRVQAVDGMALRIKGLLAQGRLVCRVVASGEHAAVGNTRHRDQVGVSLGQKMRHRHLRVAVQARPAREHEGAPLRLPAGLHKQAGKRRVGFVGARVGQHRLKAGHQFQHLLGATGIEQRHGAQLGVVLGADQHGQGGAQVLALRIELHPVGHEAGLVVPARARRRPRGERADAGNTGLVGVDKVEKAAVAVTQQVIAPARDVAAAPAAQPGAIGTQGDVVLAVGQQVRGFPAAAQRVQLAGLEHRLRDVTTGLRRQARVGTADDLARRVFMQQGLVRPHQRVAAEPAPRCVGAQHVAQRHQRHALVVRHEGFHNAERLGARLFRLACDGEVQGLVKPEFAARAQFFQALQVAHGAARIEQCGQQGGVRRDHAVGVRRAPQRQPRHAERGVLEGQRMVLREIAGLRHAPRELLRGTVGALLGHRRMGRRVQQAVTGLGHQQRGHQVFEHRARPGLQARHHAHRQEGPAEGGPVAPRNVALGNRQKAGQPGLGGQQVVITRIERMFLHAQADMKQVALAVVQAAKVHGRVQGLAARGQLQQAGLRRLAVGAALRQAGAGLRDGQQQAGQVATVDDRHIGRLQHLQRSRVVPVEQVAVVPGQAVYAVE